VRVFFIKSPNNCEEELSRAREFSPRKERSARLKMKKNSTTTTVGRNRTSSRRQINAPARFADEEFDVTNINATTTTTTTNNRKNNNNNNNNTKKKKKKTTTTTTTDAAEKGVLSSFFERHSNVYIYVPNLIGYARLLLMFLSFYCSSLEGGVKLSVFTYFLSFVCDELDGRFARKCNQCTEFGAVLDMVTDRLATTGLLIILSNIYPEMQFTCISLIFLDISSHWLQMHSQLAIGKKGHKDMRESRFRLLRLYYANRIFMGVCCVSTEVLYLCLFMAKDKELNAMPGPLPISNELVKRVSFLSASDAFFKKTLGVGSVTTFATQFIVLAIPGFLLKQIANVAQLRSAVVAMCEHEPEFARKREEKTNRD